MKIFQQLNNDQLDGLSRLCFDLAKGSLLLALFPAVDIFTNLAVALFRTVLALSLGLVFTYIALVLLKAKEQT